MFALRVLVLVLAASGLYWGVATLPSSEATENFHNLDLVLLRGEEFSPAFMSRQLDSRDAANASDCDTHALNALSIMDMRLAETALRQGNAAAFSKHTQSVQDRTTRLLSCVPHHSFSWLLAFTLETLHGRLDDHAYRLLDMSYRTSPNEAWISIRRNAAAMPFLEFAPVELKQRILTEFRLLAANGFSKEAARSYIGARPSAQTLLKSELENIDAAKLRAFQDALNNLRS